MPTEKELEKRIAAIERQLNDGNERLGFLADCLTLIILQFVEDFNITNPGIEERIEKIRQMELHS